MTGVDFLHVLLGAILVSFGVIATGLADRLRGIRYVREREEDREWHGEVIAEARARRVKQPVIEVSEAAPERVARRKTPTPASGHYSMAMEVTAALVAAGFTKRTAADAVAATATDERDTLESWTRAALRRCARGVVS